jgi:hypothetical protein
MDNTIQGPIRSGPENPKTQSLAVRIQIRLDWLVLVIQIRRGIQGWEIVLGWEIVVVWQIVLA